MAEAGLKPGWRRVKFGDVVCLNRESTKDPLADGLERYVGLEHLEPGDLRIRSWGDVAAGTTFTNRFRPGQVLFGKRRAYQRKVALADFEGVCSGDIYVLESKDSEVLSPELLPFLCQTEKFFEHAVGTSAGSLSPRTNWTSLSKYEFALPPLEEQRKVTRLLLRAEDYHSQLKDAAEAANQFFESLTMSLTLPARASFNANRTIAEVPQGWCIRRISELCRKKTDLVIGPFGSNLKLRDYQGRGSGVPVIFVRDIRPNMFVYRSGNFIGNNKALELRAHMATSGDLLITKVGVPETMGIPPGLTAVLPKSFPQAIVTADVIRARINPDLALPEYLSLLLNTPWGRQQTWRISPGSTTRFKMTLSNFSAIRLPIPSIEKQRKITFILNNLLLDVIAIRDRLSRASDLLHRKVNPFLLQP